MLSIDLRAESIAHQSRQKGLETVMEFCYGGDPFTDGDCNPVRGYPCLAIRELKRDLSQHCRYVVRIVCRSEAAGDLIRLIR